jgi:8-oxo-dGTP pyrophosphatase MutT (NUDIX family)
VYQGNHQLTQKEDFMKKKSAFVICISPVTDKILMGKKTKSEKWGFFGGKIEKDEDPRDAARREFIEETGVYPTNLKPHFIIKMKNRIIHAFAFNQLTETGLTIKLSEEHSEYKWFTDEEFNAANLKKSALVIHQSIAHTMDITEGLPINEDTIFKINVL